MVKKQLVRTEASHEKEKEDLALCMEIMGFKYEHQITRHHLYCQVRMQHETINDLVVELFGQNPQHVIFKECPKEVKEKMRELIWKRTNQNNWSFGKTTRNKLSF